MEPKDFATNLFLRSLDALHLSAVMRRALLLKDQVLSIGDQKVDFTEFKQVIVIAIGKAGDIMLKSMLETLRSVRQLDLAIVAVLVSPNAIDADPVVQQFRADHPFPGESSRAAARTILRLLKNADRETLVFFLVSGGASSMVEEPIKEEWSTNEVRAFYEGLVHSGLPIAMMNALRKHASRTKGGRLALAASPATQCTLLVSDVPEGAAHLIGSGPSLPDPSTVSDCHDILRHYVDALRIPPEVFAWLSSPSLEETPKPDNPAFKRSSSHVLLSNEDLVAQAQILASEHGYYVEVDNSCDDWDYRKAATYLLDRLAGLREKHERVCLLSGGELSVRVSSSHGTGGRNQQFALECARQLAQRPMKATVLSAGSDGIDGNSEVAGAIADQTTFTRAKEAGMDAQAALLGFDSYSVFHALGDHITTGPTGNNLRDLRVLLCG